MELFFNSVWGVEGRRKVRSKILIYIFLILMIPLFLVISGGIKLIVIRTLECFIEKWPFLVHFRIFIKLLPYLLIWSIFTLTYILLPKAKVKFSSSLMSAIIAGTIYNLTQWVYLSFQIGVAEFSAIYSSFAVLPLFLIWLQASYMIFLFGAQLNSIIDNIYLKEFEKISKKTSIRYRLLISILTLHTILKSKEKVTQRYLYDKLDIPFSLSLILLKKMHSAMVIKEIRSKGEIFYEPNFDPSHFRLNELIDKLSFAGINEIEFIKPENLSKIEQILGQFEKEREKSKANILVKELFDKI